MHELINVDSFSGDLRAYSGLSEPQLRHFRESGSGIFLAESLEVIMRALDGGMTPESVLVSSKNIELNDPKALSILGRIPESVPVYCAPEALMQTITGYQLTGGMLCAMTRPVIKDADELLSSTLRGLRRSRIAVLEDLVNPINIGAVFRSAAAFAIDAVMISSDSCDPLQRRALRISMGTVFQVPWAFISGDINETLHRHGFKTVAMTLSPDSITLDSPELRDNSRLAIMIGNEANGLTAKTTSGADYRVIIPMSHDVDSLNAAAASAVAFWELAGRPE